MKIRESKGDHADFFFEGKIIQVFCKYCFQVRTKHSVLCAYSSASHHQENVPVRQ